MATNDQDTTLSPATIAALARVYSQALDGSASYDHAIADAQRVGNTDLAQFLRDVQREDQARITKAQQLIAKLGDDRGDPLLGH